MSDLVIDIRNLTKRYKLYDRNIDRLKEALNPLGKKRHRPFFALKDVNLQVKKGEILGIVGRNGAGKSTLLNIIAGVSSPTQGSIDVRGRVTALLELGTGFNPEMTGRENVFFHGTIKGFPRDYMEKRLQDIMDFADIGDFIDQPLKTYSSGMTARLGFAVAVNIEPEILILDEVLSVGDDLFRRKCFAKMDRLFNTGCTVIYVSHSVLSVNQICSRAIFLDAGEILLEGPPKLVTMMYHKYMFANGESSAAVKKEIAGINRDKAKKVNFRENSKDLSVSEKMVPERGENIIFDSKSKQKPYFVPNFISKSKVETRNFDVDIHDICIRTLGNEKVNVLVTNEEYVFSYKVKFDCDVKNVFSNIIFKTEKGVRLGSDAIPGRKDFIDNVSKGTSCRFDWKFRCVFLKGNFFINIEIKSFVNGKRIFLNNTEDAFVFQVQKDPEMTANGIMTFNLDKNFFIHEPV